MDAACREEAALEAKRAEVERVVAARQEEGFQTPLGEWLPLLFAHEDPQEHAHLMLQVQALRDGFTLRLARTHARRAGLRDRDLECAEPGCHFFIGLA